jgi:hypothetical protein
MLKGKKLIGGLIILGLLVGCNFPFWVERTQTPTQEAGQTSTPQPPMTSSPAVEEPESPQEAILILAPGPGSRVASPVHVKGFADPTFEQTLGVRIVDDAGVVLTQQPTVIEAELGTRGPFALDLGFEVAGERHALIQVFVQSGRDGGITHLASVGVILIESGPAEIAPNKPHPERIQISAPRPGDTLAGGVAHVEGFGWASFEGTLVVEVRDSRGEVVGLEPLIVKAPDLGFPGPFRAQVSYTVQAEGLGRVVVLDPLPAFDGLGHIASVEVNLSP